MSKTLSNGTLSLRFMQNAQRAKQLAQVELEQAAIKDEAEWEVSQEIKDAWGIASSSSNTRTSTVTTHEASYIPFIFTDVGSSNAEDSSVRPRGRRTFNAKGLEVKEEPVIQTAQDKAHVAPQRVTSISGFKAPLPTKQKNSGKAKNKTAQELIREDFKTQPSSHLIDTTSSAGFLKPSGVDAPSLNRPKLDALSPAQSLKRERDSATGDASTNKKRKKKKEVQLIE
ncbi:hypothetical protein BDY19DRAFT_884858 [Irpex rosettiformis]|uniref:Uncharacterized protein n=1 Tax=Irpex rosettiformis TaxID=378272 RepID=A0ACB8UD91_9APHY|nr:hypothetical protein BDY19DRAFT_884858 [Irpex rosettiformis]